jgi:hypothetical protein
LQGQSAPDDEVQTAGGWMAKGLAESLRPQIEYNGAMYERRFP